MRFSEDRKINGSNLSDLRQTSVPQHDAVLALETVADVDLIAVSHSTAACT